MFRDAATGRRIGLAGPGKVSLRRFCGHVDAVRGRTVHGWAVDLLHPDVPARVEVYLGGNPAGAGLADRPRPDIPACGGPRRIGFTVEMGAAFASGGPVTVRVQGADGALPGQLPDIAPTPPYFFTKHPGLCVTGWLTSGGIDRLRLDWPGGGSAPCRHAFSVPAYLAGGDIHAGVFAELPPGFQAALDRAGALTVDISLDGRRMASLAFDRVDAALGELRRFVVYGEAEPDTAARLAGFLEKDMDQALARVESARNEVVGWIISFVEILASMRRPLEAARVLASLLGRAREGDVPWRVLYPLCETMGRLSDAQCAEVFAPFPEAAGGRRAAALLLQARSGGLEKAAPAVADWLRCAGHEHARVASFFPALRTVAVREADEGAFDALVRVVLAEMADSDGDRA